MHGGYEGRMRGWGGGGGGRGRGQWEPPPADDVRAWFTGRLPDNWFTATPDITVDREEILVIGELDVPSEEFTDEAAAAAAAAGRIARFREHTRDERIEIARQTEHRYGRKVSWGARIGEHEELFTTVSVPVMTRLRQAERLVLDTLVSAGVAKSRSEALSWAVKLVGEHAEAWLTELRNAMSSVDDLRREGPNLS